MSPDLQLSYHQSSYDPTHVHLRRLWISLGKTEGSGNIPSSQTLFSLNLLKYFLLLTPTHFATITFINLTFLPSSYKPNVSLLDLQVVYFFNFTFKNQPGIDDVLDSIRCKISQTSVISRGGSQLIKMDTVSAVRANQIAEQPLFISGLFCHNPV